MSTVRTRKRGATWSYAFEVGRDDKGRRKVKEKGGFPTKEAAYEAGVEAYTNWRHGDIGITSEHVTLKDFLESWLNNVCAPEVKECTIDTYTQHIKHRITPYLGGIPVQELTPAHIDKWMRALARDGLAHSTLQGIRGTLKHALDYAVYPARLIISNPVLYIKVPRNAPREVIKRVVIPLDDFSALCSAYPFGTPLHIPMQLLYGTGMRIGEVLGLAWDDVDLERRVIHLTRQTPSTGSAHKLRRVTPKTKKSTRDILISEDLARTLAKWKTCQAENELAGGKTYSCAYLMPDTHIVQASKNCAPEGGKRVRLICTRPDGRAVSYTMVSKHLHNSGLNSHSFRHTHATILAEGLAPLKGTAARLGHASTRITQDLYTHATQRMAEATEKVFEKALKEMQTNASCRQNADKQM